MAEPLAVGRGAEAAQGPDGGAPARYLTFRVGGQLYALPADEVREVIRPPLVARVPHAPDSLVGVANLRGEVLPVASLHRRLGRAPATASNGSAPLESAPPESGPPESAPTESAAIGSAPIGSARALVLSGAAPVALSVDAVDALVSVAEDAVETAQSRLAAGPGERLTGAFRSGDDVAKVLDIRAMLAEAFVQRPRPARLQATLGWTPAAGVGAVVRDHDKMITFEAAGQEFGLPLSAVREIIPVPAGLARPPHSEALVLGVAPYRDTLLPLLSLRGLLGLPTTAWDASHKVVVTLVAGVLVGLVVDRMRAILPLDPAAIEPTPPVLAARAGGEARIRALYRGDDGRRLISILDPTQLFREDVMHTLDQTPRADGDPAAPTDESGGDLKMLVFRLGDDEFALPIAVVDEVARRPDRITRLPNTPDFLDGVINLRGEVTPVIDQRRRFRMPALEDAAGQRLVVVRTERHRAGLIVDAVSQVLTVSADAVEEAPDLAGESTRLVSGVINLPETGRLVLVLDPAELLSRTERSLLDAFAVDAAEVAG